MFFKINLQKGLKEFFMNQNFSLVAFLNDTNFPKTEDLDVNVSLEQLGRAINVENYGEILKFADKLFNQIVSMYNNGVYDFTKVFFEFQNSKSLSAKPVIISRRIVDLISLNASTLFEVRDDSSVSEELDLFFNQSSAYILKQSFLKELIEFLLEKHTTIDEFNIILLAKALRNDIELNEKPTTSTIFKENNESIKTKFEAENNNNIQGFKYIRGDLSVGEKIILSLDCLYALNSFYELFNFSTESTEAFTKENSVIKPEIAVSYNQDLEKEPPCYVLEVELVNKNTSKSRLFKLIVDSYIVQNESYKDNSKEYKSIVQALNHITKENQLNLKKTVKNITLKNLSNVNNNYLNSLIGELDNVLLVPNFLAPEKAKSMLFLLLMQLNKNEINSFTIRCKGKNDFVSYT